MGSRDHINWEGERVNAFPQDEHVDLRERVNGVRLIVSVGMATLSDVVLRVVLGRGLEANESPWD